MTPAPAAKKLRVYEVAKDLGMSSEAVLQIVKRLGVEVKNHMSTLLPETVEKIQAEMAHERTAVREEQARKLVIDSVRKTLASLDQGSARRRHRRHDEDSGEVVTEEAKVIKATEFITVAEL